VGEVNRVHAVSIELNDNRVGTLCFAHPTNHPREAHMRELNSQETVSVTGAASMAGFVVVVRPPMAPIAPAEPDAVWLRAPQPDPMPTIPFLSEI